MGRRLEDRTTSSFPVPRARSVVRDRRVLFRGPISTCMAHSVSILTTYASSPAEPLNIPQPLQKQPHDPLPFPIRKIPIQQITQILPRHLRHHDKHQIPARQQSPFPLHLPLPAYQMRHVRISRRGEAFEDFELVGRGVAGARVGDLDGVGWVRALDFDLHD